MKIGSALIRRMYQGDDLIYEDDYALQNIILFKSLNTKDACIFGFDTDNDRELSLSEAAAVTDASLTAWFNYNKFYQGYLQSFDEFQYFTGLTSIGDNTFYGASNLSSIVLPDNVTSIGNQAFKNCSSLTSINLNKISTIGNGAFENCSSLTSITTKAKVINQLAFAHCTNLSYLHMTKVQTLGFAAIGDTSLEELTLPNSITSIGESCFQYTPLKSLTILASTPPTLDVNSGLPLDTSIYVNSWDVSTYKSASIWSNYANRILPIPE